MNAPTERNHLPLLTTLDAPSLQPMDKTLSPEQTALFQKIHHILQRIRPLAKRGYNPVDDYNFLQDGDITELIRQEFAIEGLVFVHDVLRIDHSDTLYTVWLQCTIIDPQNGGTYTTRTVGQGADLSDKGVPKAITAAIKHFLIKHFFIASQSEMSPAMPQIADPVSEASSKPTDPPTHPYLFYLNEGSLQPENRPDPVIAFHGTGSRNPEDPSSIVPCLALGMSATLMARSLSEHHPIHVLSSEWSTDDNALLIRVAEDPPSDPSKAAQRHPEATPDNPTDSPRDDDAPPINPDADHLAPPEPSAPAPQAMRPDQLSQELKAPLWLSAKASGMKTQEELLEFINQSRPDPLIRVTQLTNQEAQHITQLLQTR